jgi:hypothetical protein
MKKLICLLAFFSFGYVIVHAQNVTITKPVVTASTAQGEKPTAKKEVTSKKNKKDKKKDNCSSSDKKECGTSGGRKSCCSHKEEQ